jgi:hypothetical protein
MGKPARISNTLSDQEAEILQRGGFVFKELGGEDPFRRTQAEYESLLRSSLSISQAAARMDLEPIEVSRRLTTRPPALYGVRRGAIWVIPEFQLEGSRLIPGFEEVVVRLDPELHPLSVFRWFTMPNPDLPADDSEERNLSPRDWLLSGRSPAPVAELAADL